MHKRIGVIGCGMMGRNHIRIYDSMSNVNLVAVADTDIDLFINLNQKPTTEDYQLRSIGWSGIYQCRKLIWVKASVASLN